ncbi:MAG: hypothetical protein IKP00_11140 [Victivallales bacterium]|nr:hypothetical protein [Victivallales bacterium]
MKTILPFLLCLFSLPLLAQFNSYNLPKATGKITIDGKLDEPDWKQKPLITEFRPFNVINSEIPQTNVWMLQEEEALVIAVECMEEFPNALVTKARHDGSVWNDDHIEFFFDTAGERKSCVQILVNAKGVVADGIISTPGKAPDWKWECGAEVQTAVQADRWILEMRIPFASFPSSPLAPDWPFHVARSRYTMNAMHMTALKGPIKGFHEMQFFDTLCGIKCEPTGIVVLDQSFGPLFEGQNQASLTLKNENDTERQLNVTVEVPSKDGSPATWQQAFTIKGGTTMTATLNWQCSLANEGQPISMRLEMNGKRLQSFSNILRGILPTIGNLRHNALSFGNSTPAIAEFPINLRIDNRELTMLWELWTDDGKALVTSGRTAVASNQMKLRIFQSFLKPDIYRLRRFLLEDGKTIVAREDRIALTTSPWD